MSKQKIEQLRDCLIELIETARVPSGEIIFLHARVKGFRQAFELDYTSITETIIGGLYDVLSPITIITPTYTNASFRYTGIYHRLFSRSEVGRFSEEVRKNFATYRTPDPIYSVADTSSYLENLKGIDYSLTYGEGSMFDYLNTQNYVILNIGLEELFSTQIHAAERNARVPYRYNRVVSGVVYFTEDRWDYLDYQTYILESSRIGVTYPEWDRAYIEQSLLDRQVLYKTENAIARLLWARSQNLTDTLTDILQQNPNFLLIGNRE